MSTARLAASALALVLAASCSKLADLDDRGSAPGTAGPRAGTEVVVTSVVDGDTLRAETTDGEDLGRVRLLGIDAPEAAHHGQAAQCYAASATRLLARLTPVGERVRLVPDRSQGTRDAYGRLLGYLDTSSGDVGARLLRAGAADLYRYGPPLARAAAYKEAAGDARAAGEGMWRACRRR